MARARFVNQLQAALSLPLCRRMLVGRSVSLLGDFVTPVALAFAVLDELHGTATDVGFVIGASVAGTAVALLVGGGLATRHHPVAVMAGADLWRCIAQLAACGLVVSGTASLWMLVVLGLARGLGSGVFTPASQAAWPVIVPRERLLPVNATMRLLGAISVVAGPALAGVLIAVLGAGWVLGIDAVTFAWSAGVLMLVWRAAPSPVATPIAEGDSTAAGGTRGRTWRIFLARPWILAVAVQTTFIHLLVAGPLQTLAPVAARGYGGAPAYALWLSAAGLGTLVGGALLLATAPARPLVTSALTMALLTVAPLTLAVGLPMSVVFVGFLLAGIVETVTGTLVDTTIQERLTPGEVARVSALSGTATLIALPLGTALAGPVVNALGQSTTLLVMAASVPLLSLPMLLMPSVRANVMPLSAAAPDEPLRVAV